MDVKESYCANCSAFTRGNFDPTELEKSLITAIMAAPELAADRVRRVLATVDYHQDFFLVEARRAVTRLGAAKAILPPQRALLHYAAAELAELGRST